MNASKIFTCLFVLTVSLHARADYYGGYGNYGGYNGGYGHGSMPIISLELDEKESLNSSLRVAAREDRLSDLQKYVTQGGDINSQSDAGDTALIYASRNCSTKIVHFLLSNKANVNIQDRQGRTALMYAAVDSCVPVVKLLLEVPEVEISTKDRNGKTIKDYALAGAELEVGGPASETYSAIRAAERLKQRRARKVGLK